MENAPSGAGERSCARQPWPHQEAEGALVLPSPTSGPSEQRDPPVDGSWEHHVHGQGLSTGVSEVWAWLPAPPNTSCLTLAKSLSLALKEGMTHVPWGFYENSVMFYKTGQYKRLQMSSW